MKNTSLYSTVVPALWDKEDVHRPSFGFWIHGCCGQWYHPSWSLTSSSGEEWHFAVGLTMGMHEPAGVHWNGDMFLFAYRPLDFVADEFLWPRLYLLSPGFHLFVVDERCEVVYSNCTERFNSRASWLWEEGEKMGKGLVHICLCLREIYEPAVKTWQITSEIADTEVKKAFQERKSKPDYRLSH